MVAVFSRAAAQRVNADFTASRSPGCLRAVAGDLLRSTPRPADQRSASPSACRSRVFLRRWHLDDFAS
jgi:hypothetical protein